LIAILMLLGGAILQFLDFDRQAIESVGWFFIEKILFQC
jgi:hypothetical protein